MNLLKKQLKNKNLMNLFLILAVIVLVVVLYRYNKTKSVLSDNMENNVLSNSASVSENSSQNQELENNVVDSKPVGASSSEEDNYLQVQGIKSGPSSDTACNKKPIMDPKELLPTDNNNEWSNIMPNNDLKNVGMLNSAQHIGINTVGSSLRNPNLQVRSEPVIQQTNIGPWNNTTIEADTTRRSLEIGSCSST